MTAETFVSTLVDAQIISLLLTRSIVISIFPTECMKIVSQPGRYEFRSAGDLGEPCGVYVVGDADQIVEIAFDTIDVSCRDQGLVTVRARHVHVPEGPQRLLPAALTTTFMQNFQRTLMNPFFILEDRVLFFRVFFCQKPDFSVILKFFGKKLQGQPYRLGAWGVSWITPHVVHAKVARVQQHAVPWLHTALLANAPKNRRYLGKSAAFCEKL